MPGKKLAWMEDAVILAQNFKDICFLECQVTGGKIYVVSLSGILGTIDEYSIHAPMCHARP